VHLAACLAAEWGRSGVRVNAVSLGYVATPPLRATIDSGKRNARLLGEAAAMGRMVEANEIGLGVAFLLSDDATVITGINLPIDAGWLAAGGRPGDGNAARPDRSERRFRRLIATSCIRMLRRPLESAQYATKAYRDERAAKGLKGSMGRRGNPTTTPKPRAS